MFSLLLLKPKDLSVSQLHLSQGFDSLVKSAIFGSYFGDNGFDETASGVLSVPPNRAVTTESLKKPFMLSNIFSYPSRISLLRTLIRIKVVVPAFSL